DPGARAGRLTRRGHARAGRPCRSPRSSCAVRRPWSVLRQCCESRLRVVVPAERLLGVQPAVLHLLTGLAVGLVAGPDGLLEVLGLGLDDLVGGLAAVAEGAGAAQLLAGHGLQRWVLSWVLRMGVLRNCCHCVDARRAGSVTPARETAALTAAGRPCGAPPAPAPPGRRGSRSG